jgi:hypothetical protein
LSDNTKKWTPGQFAPLPDPDTPDVEPQQYEVVYYSTDGHMRRSVIESNTKNQITIATPEHEIVSLPPNGGRTLAVTGLAAATTYYFLVVDAHNGAQSNVYEITTPGEPAPGDTDPPATELGEPNSFDLTAEVQSDTDLELQWRRSGGASAEYHIFQSINGEPYTEIGSFTPTQTEGGQYAVIELDAVYRLGRQKWLPFCFYRGAKEAYYNHDPFDALGAVFLPKSSISWMTGTPPFCEEQAFNALDADVWSDSQEECSAADKPHAMHIFKSFRQLQLELMSLAPNFIERKVWDESPYIEKFSLATWFNKAAINGQVGTTGDLVGDPETSTTIEISGITLPEGYPLPITIFFAVINEDLDDTVDGFLKPSGTILQGELSITEDPATTLTHPSFGPNFVNKKLVVSFGWSRFVPREFKYTDPTTFFIPDVEPNPFGGPGGPVDPPRVLDWDETNILGVGLWSKRAKSTRYAEQTIAAPVETQEFVDGELARYIGDNWHDGIIPLDARRDGEGPLTAYYDHPNVMRRPTTTQVLMDKLRTGTATAGSTRRLVDTTKDWLTSNWYGGGIMRTESGVATGGGTTSLDDSTKILGTEDGAFWSMDRFPLFSGPYVDFIIEAELPTQVPVLDEAGNPVLDEDGEPVTEEQMIWHKRPIKTATQDSGGIHVTWDEPFHVTCNSRNWRLREPQYQINRWIGRTCKIRQILVIDNGDGTFTSTPQNFEVIVTHSDKDTLYFEPATEGYAILPGAVYDISEYELGAVYKWQAANSKWVSPVPADAEDNMDVARVGVITPQPFLKKLRNNLPTIVKRYGRMMKGDYCTHKGFFQQLYRAINALVWTLGDAGWNNRLDPDVEEPNFMATSSYRQPTEGEAVSYNDVRWAGGGPWGFNPLTGMPYDLPSAGPVELPFGGDFYDGPLAIDHTAKTKIVTDTGSVFYEYGESVQRENGHGVVSGLSTLMSSATEWFNYAQIYVPGYLNVPPDEGEQDPNVVTYNFNDNGDDVLYRRWSSWTTEPPATDAARITTDKLGPDVTVRPITPSFLEPIPDLSFTRGHFSGYMVAKQTVIVKWNVEGGMKYHDGLET